MKSRNILNALITLSIIHVQNSCEIIINIKKKNKNVVSIRNISDTSLNTLIHTYEVNK